MMPSRPFLWLIVAGAAFAGCGARPDGDSPLTHVNGENYDAVVIRSERPVLLEFSSANCRPCAAMAPHLAVVARRHGDAMVFATVDVGESDDLARKHDIEVVPTLLLIDGGQVRARREGYMERAQLVAMIQPYLSGE